MSALDQLLSALKEAKQGDNALDVQMSVLIDPPARFVSERRANAAGTKVINTYQHHDGTTTQETVWPEDFTTRIDPGLRLLDRALPDFDWIIGKTNGGLTCHAEVGPFPLAFGETPALALCIAIVQAVIAEASQPPKGGA